VNAAIWLAADPRQAPISPDDARMLTGFLSILQQKNVTPEEFDAQLKREEKAGEHFAGYATDLLEEIQGSEMASE
jgi:hypothetical protein